MRISKQTDEKKDGFLVFSMPGSKWGRDYTTHSAGSWGWRPQSQGYCCSAAQSCLTLTAAHQAPLSFTSSGSSLKLISIVSMMPSNHLILCCPLLLLPSIFPSIRVFSNESALRNNWPKYWSFSSASVLPMNIQGWFLLGVTSLISLLSKGPSRVFQHINSKASILQPSVVQLSYLYMDVCDYWKNHSFDYVDVCWQSDVSAF